MKLKKIIDVDNLDSSNFTETWILNDKHVEIDITTGKECDIFDLKKNVLSNFNEKANEIKHSREEIYKNKEINIHLCPICKNVTYLSKKVALIYNADYRKCIKCGHMYVCNRLSTKEIADFYKSNQSYSETYTNSKKSKSRIKNVIKDKVSWAISKYVKHYKSQPRSVLDVGCGGGHFVKSCRDFGLKSEGIEISDNSIRFAKDVFGLDLIHGDLNKTNLDKKYDLITLWGIIEHVEDPIELISNCKKALTDKGMIVLTSPNADSLSSYIQISQNKNIIRHLDPLGHIHLFSEKSMCKMLLTSGLIPKSAWYFGMDGYETVLQTAKALNEQNLPEANEQVKKLSSSIQSLADKFRASDSFALACILDL